MALPVREWESNSVASAATWAGGHPKSTICRLHMGGAGGYVYALATATATDVREAVRRACAKDKVEASK